MRVITVVTLTAALFATIAQAGELVHKDSKNGSKLPAEIGIRESFEADSNELFAKQLKEGNQAPIPQETKVNFHEKEALPKLERSGGKTLLTVSYANNESANDGLDAWLPALDAAGVIVSHFYVNDNRLSITCDGILFDYTIANYNDKDTYQAVMVSELLRKYDIVLAKAPIKEIVRFSIKRDGVVKLIAYHLSETGHSFGAYADMYWKILK